MDTDVFFKSVVRCFDEILTITERLSPDLFSVYVGQVGGVSRFKWPSGIFLGARPCAPTRNSFIPSFISRVERQTQGEAGAAFG